MEIIEKVHLVKIPVPFELEFVNLYLIEGDSGLTLIDCGPKRDDTYEGLNKYLQSINRSFKDITNLVITHYHVDHYGFSGEIRKLSDLSIIMHESELPLVDSYNSTFNFWVDQALNYGMPDTFVKDIKRLYELVPSMISHADVDIAVRDGQKIELDGSTYEVVWTPGHSPGHLCLYNRERKFLFTGDHLLLEITPNPGDPSFGSIMGENSLKHFLNSLNKLKEYDVDIAFPGHGSIIENMEGRVDEILIHHEERFEHILDLMNNKEQTAYEICLKMNWFENTIVGTELPDSEKPLALVEAVTHLELLRTRGKVKRKYNKPYYTFIKI
ncbi:MAG: MBL fold metallo-hydrolase [Spirochaetota bacterium]|nr:MBL fold metallo-hydrolase [Spirochaetota bacterium]